MVVFKFFADALVRSWKQITKFSPSGAAPARSDSRPGPSPARAPTVTDHTNSATANTAAVRPATVAPEFSLDGLIRDERGVRMAPESED